MLIEETLNVPIKTNLSISEVGKLWPARAFRAARRAATRT